MDGDDTKDKDVDISKIPGFDAAVDARIMDMIRSGAVLDIIADAMSNMAFVGAQSQRAASASSFQHRDMQPPRLSQLIRFRKDTGDVAGDTHFDILIPMSGGTNGVDNVTGQVEMLTQNGTTVAVAAGELTCIGTGPWWKIKGVSGRDGYPTSSINACARYNLSAGTSPGNWPVEPSADNFVGIKFYTGNDGTNPIPTAPDTALAGQYGLSWQIASIGQGADGLWTDIRQVAVGEPCKTAMMGDADKNNGTTDQPQSIKTIMPGVFEINNWDQSVEANNLAAPMLVRGSHLGADPIARLMAQPATKMGDGDASSPTQESIHTRGETNDFEIDHFGDTAVDPITNDAFVGRRSTAGVNKVVNKVVMLNASSIAKGDAEATANTDQNTIHRLSNVDGSMRIGLLLGTNVTIDDTGNQTVLIIDRVTSGAVTTAILKECAVIGL